MAQGSEHRTLERYGTEWVTGMGWVGYCRWRETGRDRRERREVEVGGKAYGQRRGLFQP